VTIVKKNDLRVYRVRNTVWVCSTLYGHRMRMAVNTTQVSLWRRPSTQTFAYAVPKGNGGVFGSRNLESGALLRGHMFTSGTFFGVITIGALLAGGDGSLAYTYSSGVQSTQAVVPFVATTSLPQPAPGGALQRGPLRGVPDPVGGLVNHQMGTMRMGSHADSSVVDPGQRFWGIPNLVRDRRLGVPDLGRLQPDADDRGAGMEGRRGDARAQS
jgi:hypothetical protein